MHELAEGWYMTSLAVDPVAVDAAQAAARADRDATARVLEAVQHDPGLIPDGETVATVVRLLADELGVPDHAARRALWILRDAGVVATSFTGQVARADAAS